MPESPNQNPTFAPLAAPRNVPESEAEPTVAPLPPLVSRVLIAGWILLFAVRGLIIQAMIATGFFGPDLPQNTARAELIEKIDSGMGHCYLFLLSVTLVVGVLRIVRGPGSKNERNGSLQDGGAQEGIALADAGTAETGAYDQGGK